MKLLSAYRYLNLLSLDVAAGAVIGAAFFAKALHVGLFPQAYVVLGLTVWIIYSADHLLDAYHLDRPASTQRHLLHQKYFRLLCLAVILALVVDVILVLFIRTQLMVPGLIMSAMCAAYLLLSRWLRYAKEVVGTLLYSGGVLLPALALNHEPDPGVLLLIARFILIVFINLLLFARMSYASDLHDNQRSLITTIGVVQADWLIAASFLALAVLLMLPTPGIGLATNIIMIAMTLTLLLIFVFPQYFRSDDRYRLVGDSVFIMPGLVLIIQ